MSNLNRVWPAKFGNETARDHRQDFSWLDSVYAGDVCSMNLQDFSNSQWSALGIAWEVLLEVLKERNIFGSGCFLLGRLWRACTDRFCWYWFLSFAGCKLKHVPSKPRVRPHSNNTSKQYTYHQKMNENTGCTMLYAVILTLSFQDLGFQFRF